MSRSLEQFQFCISDRQKKGGRTPNETTQRTTGTETTQTEPETEQTAGRTATAKPTRREQDRAKAAADERDTKWVSILVRPL